MHWKFYYYFSKKEKFLRIRQWIGVFHLRVKKKYFKLNIFGVFLIFACVFLSSSQASRVLITGRMKSQRRWHFIRNDAFKFQVAFSLNAQNVNISLVLRNLVWHDKNLSQNYSKTLTQIGMSLYLNEKRDGKPANRKRIIKRIDLLRYELTEFRIK